jgi:3-oxoacyl-[acyl-carrier protein] reductase
MSDLLGMSMRGQRVLMVGVGGIGEPCAEMCAELGAALVLADRSAPDSVAQRITDEYQIKASAHAVDMGSVASVKQLWSQVSQLGNIDALIVTAAFLPAESDMEPGSTQWEESFQEVFQVNTRGPILISQLALKQMLKKKAGRIVILGSIAGRNTGWSPCWSDRDRAGNGVSGEPCIELHAWRGGGCKWWRLLQLGGKKWLVMKGFDL